MDTQEKENRIAVYMAEAADLLKRSQPSEAYTAIFEAKQLGVSVKNLEYIYALCLLSFKQYELAREALEKEIARSPEHQDAQSILTTVVAEMQAQPSHTSQQAFSDTAEAKKLSAALKKVMGTVEVKERVLTHIKKLQADVWLEGDIRRYEEAIQRKEIWIDTLVALNWFAHRFKPTQYMEIGVRRGRSMIQVGLESPDTICYGFDMWIQGYGSESDKGIVASNPGKEFVLEECARLGVKSKPILIEGPSHCTLPEFYKSTDRPKDFDLINVDGDHTYEGAALDIEISFALLRPGGVLLFDDYKHKSHPVLELMWSCFKKTHPECLFVEDMHGVGTAIAIKPPFDRFAER